MKAIARLLVIFLMLLVNELAFAQQVIPLYTGKIPGAKETPDKESENAAHFVGKVSRPTLTIYQPAPGLVKGVAVIVCPGGGYMMVNMKLEGYDVAQQLNAIGITAFVLKYRIPDDSTMVDKSMGPLQDGQQAMLLIKTRAKEWNIDTTKIGMMGFSAGGHLAVSVGAHFNKPLIDNPSNINLRPNFMILVYPVISFTDSLAQKNSRGALIGKTPDAKEINYFSGELQVNANTPPAFILHAGDDGVVSVKNSVQYYLALQRNKVPAGLHIFPSGQHGFLKQPAKSSWFGYCAEWLRENGWLKQ
jgi:acetyl esterase/lipase